MRLSAEAPSLPEGTVTVLSTDLVGSTALNQRLGDVAATAIERELIALAQGFTDFAARDRIVVLRRVGRGTTRIPFNYRSIADGSEQDNFFVQPGDIIVVP